MVMNINRSKVIEQLAIYSSVFLSSLDPVLSHSVTPPGSTSGYRAVKPLTPKDIPDERKPVRLYKLNEPDFFTGDYRYEIEIPLPPGLGDLASNVAPKYRSGSPR